MHLSPIVNNRVSASFELVHSNVWGLCPVVSSTGFRYFVTYVDDYSRTTWLYLMKNRSELFSHFRAFYAEIHTQFHVSVQNLRNNVPKNICLNNFDHSCFRMASFIRHPVLILLLKMELLKEKIDTLMPKHFWVDVVSTACFFINRMSSSVLDWTTPFQTLFPHKSLFPIEPQVFRCTCFVREVHLHVSKLDPKSLKCIFLGYSRVQKGYRCYCPSLCRYMVSTDVTFLENTPFSPNQIHTSQGKDYDLLVYTLASLAPASVPPRTKPPITQVYARRLHPPVSSPPPTASTSDPVLSDDLPIALRKGKRQCTHPISSFCSYNHFSSHSCLFIASLDSIPLPNKVFATLAHPGWCSAMIE